MKVLTVVTHPRTDSLTMAVADRFVQGLKEAGHETEVLDLYRSGFDPVLNEPDEPDWTDSGKQYSAEVHTEMERMNRHEGLAYIFPLWWYGMPAMLKGYIDRVWNHGFAYGPRKLHHRKVLWLSLAAATSEQLAKRKYDEMVHHQLNVGLAEYAGISTSKTEFLYDTLNADPGHIQDLLEQAYKHGLHYSRE
ncbi:NAD(P)H oxidoreductase [Paenibacillus sp. UNC499MF]|uniref:NAD(P)H oxidoreductase n=1 Tax=Paenibacillus sp. UNC499MF TaxID=1502751 RepID=UPI0008A0089B|nr:NAD(P)H oxidoreductase [Paenibacillus sp. UNC499MF]SEG66837.1 Putative NADPH-quinone reductase (modulator of drug activity B) [Paenibacillus sp. UNC499MF]